MRHFPPAQPAATQGAWHVSCERRVWKAVRQQAEGHSGLVLFATRPDELDAALAELAKAPR